MEFPGENFLLNNKTAVRLYHEYAARMPIFDYHCHLPVKDIAGNRQFKNITEIWLAGDHYKWRAMRANGIEEKYITGNAGDFEKFQKWAETVPATLRNPLFHWTYMELKNPFGITGKLLNPGTAAEIYAVCNDLLQSERFSTRNLISNANVKILCTTDDPADDLAYHKALAADKTFLPVVLPAFRPDQALFIDNPAQFNPWMDKLGAVLNREIGSYEELLACLEQRIDFFHAAGCRISDHGLSIPYSEPFDEKRVNRIFRKVRRGHRVTHAEALEYQSALLFSLAGFYHKKGWAMQLHMGAIRNVNSRGFQTLGPDTGYDTIGDFTLAAPLCRFLDRLATAGRLPRTVLYIINPADNDLIAVVTGCFQDADARGKIQFGAAWWFNDHKQGMIRQLDALSGNSLLAGFIGMLTDSRSFLSFSRHDYFRRILCNMLGTDAENGELPADYDLLGKVVADICYDNAIAYFRVPYEK